MSQQLNDFRRGWRSTASQPAQPAASLPTVEDFVTIAFDAEAAPKAGSAFDGHFEFAAQRGGNLFGQWTESAGAAKVDDNSRGQVTTLRRQELGSRKLTRSLAEGERFRMLADFLR